MYRIDRRQQLRSVLTFLLAVLVIFLLMVFIVPELKVAEVIDGEALTNWQKFHEWFVLAKTWLIDNFYLLVITLIALFGFYKLVLKTTRNRRY